MVFVVTTAPTSEPVSLAEAKAAARIDDELVHDRELLRLIQAAREAAESYTQRSIMPQTLTLYLDAFDAVIRLPRAPVTSVTSVKYLDDAGVQQTLAASKYRVDLVSYQPRITPGFDEPWPITRPVTNAIEIEYVTGYASVPVGIKDAILGMVAHSFDTGRPMSVDDPAAAALGPYRLATYP